MELSKSSNELLIRAQMRRLAQNASDLAPEHILCILLELESPDPLISTGEVQAVNTVLNDKLACSLSVAQKELSAKLLAGSIPIEDDSGMDIINRADELAEARSCSEITPQLLTEAIFDLPTEVIRAMMKPPSPPETEYEDSEDYSDLSDDWNSEDSEEDHSDLSDDRISEDSEEDHSDLSYSQIFKALKELDKQEQSFKVRRRTKMGLFTYRGGPVWAAVQYFFLGISVPFLILLLLEHFTGCVSAPPTPIVCFFINAFITASIYSLLNGMAMMLGRLFSDAFGNFLFMLCEMFLAYGLAVSAKDAWGMLDFPYWLKWVLFFVCAFLLIGHNALYEELEDQDDTVTLTILGKEMEGTPGKIFFQFLGKNLVLPYWFLSVIRIEKMTLPLWLNRTLWCIGFLIVCEIGKTMWECLILKMGDSDSKFISGLVMFCHSFYILMMIPCFILFMHWLFAWSPVKLFVWIFIGIWTLIALIKSLMIAIN